MAEYENNRVVETQPTEPDLVDEPGHNWLRIIGMILAAIVVSVLLIFVARWIYQSFTDDNAPTTTQNPRPSEGNKAPAGQGPQQTANPAPQNQPAGGGNALPNSGPEHVAALFAGSSLIGAGVHYAVTRRTRA